VGHLTPTEAPAQLRRAILGREVSGPRTAGDAVDDPAGGAP
jgi:hypothetical protein